jgi:small subunit ribosomal protein S16
MLDIEIQTSYRTIALPSTILDAASSSTSQKRIPCTSLRYLPPDSEAMVLRIRLARFGRTRQPIYNIVLSHARKARGSKPLEVLGTFDPIPRVPLAARHTPEFVLDDEGKKTPFVPKKIKDIKLDMDRTKYWLGVGAQPSEPVEKILVMLGMMVPRPRRGSAVLPKQGSAAEAAEA